jgi:hypothetical protein
VQSSVSFSWQTFGLASFFGNPQISRPPDALLGRVAGDQGAVDGTDRDAGHPVGMKIGFGQCLVDARLIGTQRAAAL